MTTDFTTYTNTLELIETIRNGNMVEFERLLPLAKMKEIAYAPVHVACFCNQVDMLKRLLEHIPMDEFPEEQGLVWAIEQNNREIIDVLLPRLHSSTIEKGLVVARDPLIIDLLEPYVGKASHSLVREVCVHNNLNALRKLLTHNKIEQKFVQRACMALSRTPHTEAMHMLLQHTNGQVFSLSQTSKINILARCITPDSCLEMLETLLPHCDPEMYFGALEAAVSKSLYPQFCFLLDKKEYTSTEISSCFNMACKRSNSQIVLDLLKADPLLENKSTEALGCAVRANDRTLFDQLLPLIFQQEQGVENAYRAVATAARFQNTDFLERLEKVIDLNAAHTYLVHHVWQNDPKHTSAENYLLAFIAQQQKQRLVSEIDPQQRAATRKM